MLRNNYEISTDANNYNLQFLNGSDCYSVAKSRQDHQGSQSEQLRTFGDILRRSFCLQQSVLAYVLTDGHITMLSDSQGCALFDFALIL